jgi:hypothetical protein
VHFFKKEKCSFLLKLRAGKLVETSQIEIGAIMENTINNLIKALHELESFLLLGTIADGDSTKHLYIRLKNGVNVLEREFEINTKSTEEWKEYLLEFKKFYMDLKHQRVGLDSLFVWKDDYEERVKINTELNELKSKIISLLAFQ